jgi:hypothetical protein
MISEDNTPWSDRKKQKSLIAEKYVMKAGRSAISLTESKTGVVWNAGKSLFSPWKLL